MHSNILVLRSHPAKIDFTLLDCVGRQVDDILLTGQLASPSGTARLSVFAGNSELYNEIIAPQTTVEFSLAWLFGWLALRNIRVDAVVHEVTAEASRALVLESLSGQPLDESAECVAEAFQAIHELSETLPQTVSMGSFVPPEFLSALAQLAPPGSWQQNKRVRCTSCAAEGLHSL